jgi:predicted alpha/beta-hydrolase family hydrolase
MTTDIETPHGPARLTWLLPPDPAGLVLLGHGAGGGVNATDLQSASQQASRLGYAVGLVEQPYRVAGRRAPAPAAQLDAAFTAVATAARAQTGIVEGSGRPLIVGGRSSGARVACRTARAIGAAGVLALAFPLQPVRRTGALPPSRLPELLGAAVPVLVVQGERDAFGSAAAVKSALAATAPTAETQMQITVSVAERADHALRRGVAWPDVASWLARFLP